MLLARSHHHSNHCNSERNKSNRVLDLHSTLDNCRNCYYSQTNLVVVVDHDVVGVDSRGCACGLDKLVMCQFVDRVPVPAMDYIHFDTN